MREHREPHERRFHTGEGPHGGRMHGHRGAGRGRGFGRPGGWQQADLPSADDAAAWFAGRLPDDWFTGAPSVEVDREEITVIGELAAPEGSDDTAAAEGRISRFREDTRGERMAKVGELRTEGPEL